MTQVRPIKVGVGKAKRGVVPPVSFISNHLFIHNSLLNIEGDTEDIS